ncbi:hypothetical protein [Chryseobacterium sp. T1]
MKSQLSILFLSLLLIFSCRAEDESVQTIDQVLNIYVKNTAGKDLINPKIKNNYTQVQFLDLLAETNLKPISGVSIIQDKDTISYIDYVAGAVRLIKDSVSTTDKTYYSEFVMRLSKTENTTTINDDKNVKVEYSWTPSRFQVSKMWFGGKLVFTKTEGQPNIVQIVK